MDVNLKDFQNKSYYGSLDIDGKKNYLRITYVESEGKQNKQKENKSNEKVKVTFRRNGNDVTVTYERNQKHEISDTDKQFIEKVLKEIDKPQNPVQEKMKNIFSSIINKPSKKRGPISKFLP